MMPLPFNATDNFNSGNTPTIQNWFGWRQYNNQLISWDEALEQSTMATPPSTGGAIDPDDDANS